MGKRITGKELLDGGIEVFELVAAIKAETLLGCDPITGKPVLDLNTPRQVPRYTTLEEARAGCIERMEWRGEKTEEQKTIRLIQENPSLFLPVAQVDMLEVARIADENRFRLSLETATDYPAGTHQYDFNPEAHRSDLPNYMQVLHGLLFEPAEVLACFPAWRPSGQGSIQIIPSSTPMEAKERQQRALADVKKQHAEIVQRINQPHEDGKNLSALWEMRGELERQIVSINGNMPSADHPTPDPSGPISEGRRELQRQRDDANSAYCSKVAEMYKESAGGNPIAALALSGVVGVLGKRLHEIDEMLANFQDGQETAEGQACFPTWRPKARLDGLLATLAANTAQQAQQRFERAVQLTSTPLGLLSVPREAAQVQVPTPAERVEEQAQVVAAAPVVKSVPGDLFVGKSSQAAKDSMLAAGLGREVVAYVLKNFMDINLKEIGKLLDNPEATSADKMKKKGEKADKTYWAIANNLLKKANKIRIIQA